MTLALPSKERGGQQQAGPPPLQENPREVRLQLPAQRGQETQRAAGTLSLLSEAVNVVFLGPPGVRKSHLSAALGMAAFNRGMSVYFIKVHNTWTHAD